MILKGTSQQVSYPFKGTRSHTNIYFSFWVSVLRLSGLTCQNTENDFNPKFGLRGTVVETNRPEIIHRVERIHFIKGPCIIQILFKFLGDIYKGPLTPRDFCPSYSMQFLSRSIWSLKSLVSSGAILAGFHCNSWSSNLRETRRDFIQFDKNRLF